MLDENVRFITPPAKIRTMSYVGDLQGCGYIRVIMPSLLLNNLRNRYDIESMYSVNFIGDPYYYKTLTHVTFQRAATEGHLGLFNHFVSKIKPIANVPIIYECDDDLFNIPKWNFASTYYTDNRINIEKILSMADGITVSTEKLKQLYGKYNENVVVIENHLAKFMWGGPLPFMYDQNKKIRIGWAGSENHFINTKSKEYGKGVTGGDFGKEFIKFIKKTVNKYQWVISGAIPIELSDVKDKIEFYSFKPLLEYPAHLKSLKLDIFVAPLEKCEFNDGKSNIKALEAAVLDVPGVYSNVEPYKNMTLTSDDDYGMIEHIERLASDVDYRYIVACKDYDIVKNQLYWEENDNLMKYVNAQLSLFNVQLKG